jgi:hypothetical protein
VDTACGERATGVTVRVGARTVRAGRGGRFRVRVKRGSVVVRAVDAAGQRSSSKRLRVR